MPRITPAEFAATQVKIQKINDRAVKRGFTGRLDIVGDEVEVTETGPLGFKVTKIMVDAHITGDPPKHDGWTFLARIDIEDGGLIVHGAPGAPQVNRDTLQPGWCDHCRTNRHRTKTFVVGGDDGTQLQVGTTCIKDFLGWDGNVVFFTDTQFDDDDDFWGGGGGESQWTIETILATAWATIATFGYNKADDLNPTKYTVLDLLAGTTKDFDRTDLDNIRGLAGQAIGKADEIRDFILGDDFAGDSDYVLNLKTLVGGRGAGPGSIGLLASAPQAWLRHNEQQIEKAADPTINEFVGNPKDKVELTVTVKAIRFIDGQYGTTTLYTMVDDTNHRFKWFASRPALGQDVEGETFRVKGTIKGHDEWQGQKSTVLTRVKETIGATA